MARLSNYELVRVLSMIFIVFHHFSVHSSWRFSSTDASLKRQCVELLGTGGKVGVDLFLMLTGYFLAGRSAKVVSILRTWIQVVEYSWAIYGIFLLTDRKLKIYEFVQSAFPVVCFNYWFVTSYMVVVLLSPAIGKMASNMSHHEFIGALIVMFTVMSLIRYFYKFAYSDSFWFMFLYLLGSYFKIFERVYARYKTRTYFMCLVVTFIINVGAIVLFSTHNFHWVDHHGGIQMLTIHTFAPLPTFMSIFIFLFVGRLEFSSSVINTLASTTFGVYLIHDNPYMRKFIWMQLINGRVYYYKSYFYPLIIGAPMAVYLTCSLIDWIRQLILGPFDQWLANHLANTIIKVGKSISHCFVDPNNSEYYELETLDLECQNLEGNSFSDTTPSPSSSINNDYISDTESIENSENRRQLSICS